MEFIIGFVVGALAGGIAVFVYHKKIVAQISRTKSDIVEKIGK